MRERAFIQASIERQGRLAEQARRAEATAANLKVRRLLLLMAGWSGFLAVVVVLAFGAVFLVRSQQNREWEILRLSGLQIAEVGSVLVVLSWGMILSVLYWRDPGRLVQWHEAFPEPGGFEDAVKALDKITFGAATILRWILEFSILHLGTSARALDAWVERRADESRAQFQAHPTVRDRRIAVDLPVKINGKRHGEPWSELKRLISGDAPMAILISGPGGAGKTTLACRIGSRALGPTDLLPLGRHRILPLLVDADVPEEAAKAGGLYQYVAGLLRSALNEKRRMTVALIKALLRSGRVLVIVDGLSERSSASGRAFDPQRHGFEIRRLIVTSRDRVIPGISTVVETETIPSAALFDFLDRYLKEMQEHGLGIRPSEDRIFHACADLTQLLRRTPCTPLLAGMWAREIGAPIGEGKPRAVTSLMDSYVRRLFLPAANGNEAFVNRLTKDATKIAETELGDQYRPINITRSAALEALKALDSEDLDRRLKLLEKSQILEAPTQDSDNVRIAPDPIAEHLVARLRMEELGGNTKAWRTFLTQVRRVGSPEGFVAALAACVEDDVYGRKVPILVTEQIRAMRDNAEEAKTAA
jgi:hypothetical protein